MYKGTYPTKQLCFYTVNDLYKFSSESTQMASSFVNSANWKVEHYMAKKKYEISIWIKEMFGKVTKPIFHHVFPFFCIGNTAQRTCKLIYM